MRAVAARADRALPPSSYAGKEFKGLARRFGALLVQVVATIDQHGLRRRDLGKHKPDVQTFFRETCDQPYQSAVAEKYRKRLVRYEPKLFAFLDHDGVPWHNNNAEHAVKHFAKYRRICDGQWTAKGLRAYLVLLSLDQTCVYRKVSFLRFLLSGEADIDAFAQSRRRRRAGTRPAEVAGADGGATPPATDAREDPSGSTRPDRSAPVERIAAVTEGS